MAMTTQAVQDFLSTIIEPQLKWNLIILNLVKNLEIDEQSQGIRLTINLITEDTGLIHSLREQIESGLKELGFKTIELTLGRVNVATEGVDGINAIVLVGSGKGGVGKSSVAVHLSRALLEQGLAVGLMDADIYGPSVPVMLGNNQKPEVLPGEYLMPISIDGLKTMSMGYLIPEDQSIDWRGQMLSATILQFIRKTFWGKLDILVVDLPPGTGDAILTLAHSIKSDGLVLVSTAADVALADVKRAISLFKAREIPILGLVENMAYLNCSACDHRNETFPGHSEQLDKISTEIELLTQLPLTPAFSKANDQGQTLRADPATSSIADNFDNLAKKIITKLVEKKSIEPAIANKKITIDS